MIDTFTRNEREAVLQRIDDIVAIAEYAADQRHITAALPGARDDLRLTAIGIQDVSPWRAPRTDRPSSRLNSSGPVPCRITPPLRVWLPSVAHRKMAIAG